MKAKVNPYKKREMKNNAKSVSKMNKTVKPVAKDTNKTRRYMPNPLVGDKGKMKVRKKGY